MSTGCQKDRTTCQKTRQKEDKTTFQLSYQNKSCSECKQDVKKSQTDRKIYSDIQTERQNDSMTVSQNTRTAKEPTLVFCSSTPVPVPIIDLVASLKWSVYGSRAAKVNVSIIHQLSVTILIDLP